MSRAHSCKPVYPICIVMTGDQLQSNLCTIWDIKIVVCTSLPIACNHLLYIPSYCICRAGQPHSQNSYSVYGNGTMHVSCHVTLTLAAQRLKFLDLCVCAWGLSKTLMTTNPCLQQHKKHGWCVWSAQPQRSGTQHTYELVLTLCPHLELVSISSWGIT